MKHHLLPIRVCMKDILEGQPDCDTACPIGLAIQRQLAVPPGELEVAKTFVRIRYNRIVLPKSAQEFIKRFDVLLAKHSGSNFKRDKHFKPFNFILDTNRLAINEVLQRKRGRPVKLEEDRKSDTLIVKLQTIEKEKFNEAAKRACLSVSEWVRERLKAIAEKERTIGQGGVLTGLTAFRDELQS
jgi:hypothetical protein